MGSKTNGVNLWKNWGLLNSNGLLLGSPWTTVFWRMGDYFSEISLKGCPIPVFSLGHPVWSLSETEWWVKLFFVLTCWGYSSRSEPHFFLSENTDFSKNEKHYQKRNFANTLWLFLSSLDLSANYFEITKWKTSLQVFVCITLTSISKLSNESCSWWIMWNSSSSTIPWEKRQKKPLLFCIGFECSWETVLFTKHDVSFLVKNQFLHRSSLMIFFPCPCNGYLQQVSGYVPQNCCWYMQFSCVNHSLKNMVHQ